VFGLANVQIGEGCDGFERTNPTPGLCDQSGVLNCNGGGPQEVFWRIDGLVEGGWRQNEAERANQTGTVVQRHQAPRRPPSYTGKRLEGSQIWGCPFHHSQCRAVSNGGLSGDPTLLIECPARGPFGVQHGSTLLGDAIDNGGQVVTGEGRKLLDPH
jgi:hypothetical protein